MQWAGSIARAGAPICRANSANASTWSAWWWVSSTSSTGPYEASRSRWAASDGPGSTTTTPGEPGARST